MTTAEDINKVLAKTDKAICKRQPTITVELTGTEVGYLLFALDDLVPVVGASTACEKNVLKAKLLTATKKAEENG